MQTLEQLIPDALNSHIFDKIWNEPYSEFRENIKPMLLTKRSVSGAFSTFFGSITLPTTDEPYFVFGLSDSDLCVDFPFVGKKWTATDELCNTHGLLIHTYTYKGHMCHKNQVYFRYSADGNHLYMAITQSMLSSIITLDQVSEIYFTVYYDSDMVNPITVHSRKIPGVNTSTAINEITKLYSSITNKDQVTLFVNGWEYSGAGYSPQIGDYIDIVVDENVVSAFEVDLTDSIQHCKYYSTKDACYKYVIHIPKALNTDGNVYTHNTSDLYIRPKTESGNSVRGLYVHRCADLSVGQITHNDFSIPLYIVDAYRDHVDNQHVTIRVQVRKHDKDNKLLRDKSYIDLLYTHDDEGILYFLRGQSEYPQLHFWSAAELEASVYISMMFDIPDEISPANMHYYVEGLGYYHVLALICQRVHTSVITDAYARVFTYTKPYLYRGYAITPAVYIDGIKINNSYVRIVDDSTDTFTVEISDTILVKAGQIMTMVMYLDGVSTIYQIQPTEGNRTFPIGNNGVRIYETIDTYVPDRYRGVDASSGVRYRDVTDAIGLYQIVDGAVYCGDAMLHKNYLIQHDYCTYWWNEEIDHLVHAGENLAITLALPPVGNSTARVPLLHFRNAAIYLNGKYLVHYLDYQIKPIITPEGDVSFIQLIIQSFEYVKDHGNIVEIYLNVAEIEDTSFGFIVQDKIFDITPANLWFPNISVCHAGGNVEQGGVNRGIHIEVPVGKYHNGIPFEVETAVPEVVRDFLDKYHVNDDKARLEILNDYFYGRTPPLDGLILLPGSHRLYSVYLNRIIKDIIADTFSFAVDPDVVRIKDQLQDYDYLLALDSVLSMDGDNLKMVDRYPAYQQYTTTAEKRMLIKTLISIFLSDDEIVAGGDFYE